MATIKIYNNYGYYTFEPQTDGGIDCLKREYPTLIPLGNGRWTYPLLYGLSRSSFEGAEYANMIALKTYEGEPWEVMKANGWTFDIYNEKLALVELVAQTVAASTRFARRDLMQDGVLTTSGRIRRYTCKYDSVLKRFFYYDIGLDTV